MDDEDFYSEISMDDPWLKPTFPRFSSNVSLENNPISMDNSLWPGILPYPKKSYTSYITSPTLPKSILTLNNAWYTARLAQIKKEKSDALKGKIGAGLGVASDIGLGLLTSIAGPKMGSDGPNAGLTLGIDSTYDAVSDAAMQINPLVGGIMKAAGLAGNVLNSVGGGTDGMTKKDAVFNSAPMTLLTLGLNGFLGLRADTITKDTEAFALVGSSYGGTSAAVDDALTKSGKKYGAISSSDRIKANELIAEAKRLLTIMANVSSEATDRFKILNSMSGINNSARLFAMLGGYDLSSVRVGRHGMSIQSIYKARRVAGKYKLLKLGGSITKISTVTPTNLDNLKDLLILPIESFKRGGKHKMVSLDDKMKSKPRSLEELIQYAKELNPRFIQRLSETPKGITFIDDNGNEAYGTHYLEWATDDKNNAIIYPRILENDKNELLFYNSDDAYLRAILKHDYLIMTPEEAEIFFAPNGLYGTAYKLGWPDFFLKFAERGKFNVIPEGALHARLHHMENADNLTKKGIPVVSEKENGELEQQAEIERNEIILRLELTNKIEELYKKYSSNECSLKEKDELAALAGKLLTYEILENTVDNTGLIDKII